jgi:threonine synthase
MLRAIRDTGGGAIAVSDDALCSAAGRVSASEGVDLAPEGGAAVAAVVALREAGSIGQEERVVLFNTGAGWLYR